MKPVKRIEISQTNTTVRIILVAVLLAVGLTLIGWGIYSAFRTETGWQEIEANSQKINCSQEFSLHYNISTGAERKALIRIYTQLVEDGYTIFSTGLDGLNEKPGEAVTVDPALYRALTQIMASGNRCLYLGPAYAEYDRVFLCQTREEAAQYDPLRNEELKAYLAQVAAFAADPETVRLEAVGENQLRLCLSDGYKAFAQEQGITRFLDFGWMRNAFIVDYMAQTLMDAGYTRGFLSSYDGFTRNLDTTDTGYSMNVFDRIGNVAYVPAVFEYKAPAALVFLRNYPLDQRDEWHYFAVSDERIITTMVDPSDGLCKSATDNVLSYSQKGGCADMVLALSRYYLADTWDEGGVNSLTSAGIYSIWFDGTQLRYNESGAKITLVTQPGDPDYRLTYAGE